MPNLSGIELFTRLPFMMYGELSPFQLHFPTLKKPRIKIGDFVKERHTKKNPGHNLGYVTELVPSNGKVQVKIKVIKSCAEKIGYWFPVMSDNSWICDDEHFKDRFAYVWEPVDSVVKADGYSVKELAEILYPNYHHSVYEPKDRKVLEYSQNPMCWFKGCHHHSVGVGIINVWGSVVFVVMCKTHTEYHGMCCDTNQFIESQKK